MAKKFDKLYLIVLSINLFFALPVFSQTGNDFLFENITKHSTQTGLSQNSIYCIAQDSIGFMWFGTQAGLDRYDGREFVPYRYQSNKPGKSLTKGAVTALFATKDFLLVSTTRGLSKIYYSEEHFDFVIDNINKKEGIIDITRVGSDIYFATKKNVFTFNGDSICSFQDSTITGIEGVPGGFNEIVIGTDKGLVSFDKDSKQLIDFFEGEKRDNGGEITGLYYNPNTERLFIGKGNLAFCFSLDVGDENRKIEFVSKIDLNSSSKSTVIENILESYDGKVWLGTKRSGLYHCQFYEDSIRLESNPILFDRNRQFSISSNLISSLFQSRDGVIWVGNIGQGIDKLTTKKPFFFSGFQKTPFPEDRPFRNDVWSFLLKDSTLFVGTDGDGVAKFDLGRLSDLKTDEVKGWVRHKEQNDIYKNSILSLCLAKNDSLLIGTANGLYHISPFDTIYERNVLEKEEIIIRSIKYSEKYKKYLIGTVENGLIILNEHLKRDTTFIVGFSRVFSMEEGASGTLFWIGTNKGLFTLKLRKDSVRFENTVAFKGDTSVRSILQTKDALWLGTDGDGLFYTDVKTLRPKQFDPKKRKLKDGVIYGILNDDNNNLWICTNNGISRVTPNLSVNNYSLIDGLQHREFNTGAYYKTLFRSKTILFFGGVNGFNWLYPKPNMTSKYHRGTPVTIFTKVTKAGKESGFKRGRDFTLDSIPYDGREVSLFFPIFDFHDPKNNHTLISQKIIAEDENQKEHWSPNDLVPISANGFYNDLRLNLKENNFNVDFRSSSREWSSEFESVNFRINVIPSKEIEKANKLVLQRWFMLFGILGLGVGLSVLLYYFIKRKERNKELEDLNQLVVQTNQKLGEKNKELDTLNQVVVQTNQKLENKNETLSRLNLIINETTREETTSEIIKIVVNKHLTGECFQFDFATIYFIEKYEKRIREDIYRTPDSPKLNPPPSVWRNIELGGTDALKLIENDVLEIVYDEKVRVKVKGEQITVLDKKKKSLEKIIKLDPKVYEECNHSTLKRVFIPIIRVAKGEEGFQERDYTFGVLQAGFHINNEKELDDELLINLQLYTDNFAQVYFKAFKEENRIKNKDLVDKHFGIKEPKKYLETILGELVENYKCNFGDISIVTYDEQQQNWVPSGKEVIVSKGLRGIGLAKIRKDSIGRKGIFRFVLEEGRYYFTNDVENDKYYINGLEKVRSQLSVLLETYGKKIGTINLYSEKLGFFDEFKAQNIQFLGDIVADIYQRKKATYLTEKLVPPLNIHLESKNIYEKIIEILKMYFSSEFIGFWVLDEKGELKKEKFIHGCELFEKNDIFVPSRFNKSNYSDKIDIYQIDSLDSKVMFSSLIQVPIQSGSSQTGIFQIFTKRKIEKLFPEDEIFLSQVASKCSLSVQSADIFKRFSHMADSLVEDNPEDVYKQIVKSAKNEFDADLVLLFKVLSGSEFIVSNAILDGELYKPMTPFEAKKEINQPNLVHDIIKRGSAFIENKKQYLKEFDPDKREWASKKYKNDFWIREKIESFAAIKLEVDGKPQGVLFINYRKKEQAFSENFKNILGVFGKLSAQTIIHANILEENVAFKKMNLRLTKPLLESSLVSGIAHNTSNILGSLNRRINDLRNELKKQNGISVHKEIVLENLLRIEEPLSSLITDYQKLADFRKTSESSIFEEIQLKRLIGKVIDLVRGRANKNKVDIKFINKFDPLIIVDINFVEHAILNLILNSIEEMKSYGGEIRIQSEKMGKNYFKILVSDNGPGIKKKDYSEIFKPYFSTKKEGTGVGLPITKYIIETVHNGTLNFRSKVNQGTTFEIIIPLKPKKKLDD